MYYVTIRKFWSDICETIEMAYMVTSMEKAEELFHENITPTFEQSGDSCELEYFDVVEAILKDGLYERGKTVCSFDYETQELIYN